MAGSPRTPPPPPVIGKAGNLTVFITPPAAPVRSPQPDAGEAPERSKPEVPVKEVAALPPVQVPPLQYEKGAAAPRSVFGFFWDAVARVQEAHSSLDEYVANLLGLDQSKYQWALNDYFEASGKEVESCKPGKPSNVKKVQEV